MNVSNNHTQENLKNKLEFNKEYTYKEIVKVLGWKEQSGDSKQAQIREIESAYEFYHPINKKTKKNKKSYIFTAQLREPIKPSRKKNTETHTIKKIIPTTPNQPLTLDTSVLQVGQQIKNYKELCLLLNQPEYGGTQKKNQLKEFERFFIYEKTGHKFLIKEIFNGPIPHVAKCGNHSKYTQDIETILLTHILQAKDKQLCVTKSELYELLGLFNGDYLVYKRNHKPLLDLSPDMTMFEIHHFFERCDTKFNDIVKSAIASLERRQLIRTSIVYQIGSYAKNNNNVKSWYARKATTEELHLIQQVEQLVLTKFHMQHKYELLRQNKTIVRAYFRTLRQMFKGLYGWTCVKECYCFSLHPDYPTLIHENSNINVSVQKLNSNIYQALNDQAETKFKKNMLEASVTDLKSFHYPTSYIDMQLMLSNKLIKLSDTQL